MILKRLLIIYPFIFCQSIFGNVCLDLYHSSKSMNHFETQILQPISSYADFTKVLRNLINVRGNRLDVTRKFVDLGLPYFIANEVTNCLYEKIEWAKKSYGRKWKSLLAASLLNHDSSIVDLLLHDVRNNVTRNHFDWKSDRSKVQEILKSPIPNSLKWIIIDGVMSVNFKKAWPTGTLLDPIDQLLYFETQYNTNSSGRTSMGIPFSLRRVSSKDAKLIFAHDDFAQQFKQTSQFMDNEGNFLIPEHPMSGFTTGIVQDSVLPFRDMPEVDEIIGFLTASRTSWISNYFFKMGATVADPGWGASRGKEDMKVDIEVGLRRSRQIFETDQRMGRDPRFKILLEVAAFVESKSGQGVLIRDPSPILDGNYYVPALSIWKGIGKKIADDLGVNFEELWIENFARSFGRLKAYVFLRYALRMHNPHEQQWLLEMERVQIEDGWTLRPTGRAVLRDLADTDLVSPVAEVIAPDALVEDLKNGPVYSSFSDLGLYQFHGSRFVNAAKFNSAHEEAIKQTIEHELGIHLPENWQGSEFLSSKIFTGALKKYHLRSFQ